MDNKTIVSTEEFTKRVEIEMEYLIYMDRMNPDEAHKKARWTVSQKYEMAGNNYHKNQEQKTQE